MKTQRSEIKQIKMSSLKKRKPESPKVSSLIGFFENLNKINPNCSQTEKTLHRSYSRKLTEAKFTESPTRKYLHLKPVPIKKQTGNHQNDTPIKTISEKYNLMNHSNVSAQILNLSSDEEDQPNNSIDSEEDFKHSNNLVKDSTKELKHSKTDVIVEENLNDSCDDFVKFGEHENFNESYGESELVDAKNDGIIIKISNADSSVTNSNNFETTKESNISSFFKIVPGLTKYFTGSSAPSDLIQPKTEQVSSKLSVSPSSSRHQITDSIKESSEDILSSKHEINKYLSVKEGLEKSRDAENIKITQIPSTINTNDSDSTEEQKILIKHSNASAEITDCENYGIDSNISEAASSTINCQNSGDSDMKEHTGFTSYYSKYNLFKYFSNYATNEPSVLNNADNDNSSTLSEAPKEATEDKYPKSKLLLKQCFSESIGESFEIIDDFISHPSETPSTMVQPTENEADSSNLVYSSECINDSSNLAHPNEKASRTYPSKLLRSNEAICRTDSSSVEHPTETEWNINSSNLENQSESNCRIDYSNDRDSSILGNQSVRNCSSDSSNLVNQIESEHSTDSSLLLNLTERDCRTDSSYFSNDEDESEDGYSRPTSLDMGLDSSYELIDEFRVLSPVVTKKMPIYENITINLKGKEGERIIELQRHNEHRESIQSFMETKFNVDNNITKRVSKTKKDYIIEELLKTEESYIKNLEHICKNYIEYMKEQNVFNYKDIYGNLENIYLETELLYSDLILCGDNHEDIGKAFIRHKNLFNRYPSYCKNKKRSQRLMLSKYYCDEIKAREETIKDHLDLSSYLLAPIQRLAKYEQLLKNLYKYLKDFDVETSNLESAIVLIQRISRTSNDIIILDSIENNEFSVNSTGEFIEMQSFRMHSPKKMDVVLFMFQKVIIFTAQNPKHSERYVYKSHIPVDALSRKSEPDSVIFTLEDFYKRKKHNEPQYILEARSLKVKNDWIAKIEKILWDQLVKQKEEVNRKIGSTQGNCDQIHLLENSQTCDSTV